MGGFQKNFIWGLGEVSNSIEQLENEYNSILNPTYNYGENSTPYTFNGKPVYVYVLNPNQNYVLPGSGYLTLPGDALITPDTILNISVLAKYPNWEVGMVWTQLPMVKRNNAQQQLMIGIGDTNALCVKNYGITGNVNLKGTIWYTKTN